MRSLFVYKFNVLQINPLPPPMSRELLSPGSCSECLKSHQFRPEPLGGEVAQDKARGQGSMRNFVLG